MKKALLSLGLGLLATAASAQVTFPVRIGFENADKSDLYHSKYANNVDLSEFGDWVNPHQDVDIWTEQAQDDAKNGQYCFMAQNTDKLNPWDRGFKLANLPIKENTPYRMSFWVKGTAGNVITAWLSKGVEQLDKSFISSSNSGEYGINQKVMSGEWEHMSFVAFYENAAPYNSWLANTSWAGGATVGDNIPESLWEGAGVNDSNKDKTYRDFFNGAVPEEFFAIVNMFDGGTYLLDDICIEEGVYFNQATGNGNVIRLDFGYDTNIKTLVAATKKGVCLMLDKEQFSVAGAVISSVEAHADGFVYIFLEDAMPDNATVSFTPNDECPLEYAGNRQPTSDFTQTIKIKGFENEVVYEDETIDVESHNTSVPELDSCYPENGSFDLPNTTNEWVFVFDIPVDAEGSIATLEGESGTIGELALSLGNDEKTLVAKYDGTLKNGSYTIKLEVANEAGDASFYDDETNPAYKFSIGATGFDPDLSSEVVYESVFEDDPNNSVPSQGRFVFGKDADGNDVILNPGEGRGSGARLFTDFAEGGQFTAALYSRDWDGNGQYEIGVGEGDQNIIQLEEGTHKLSFTWAQWKAGATLSEVMIYKVGEDGEFTDLVWQNDGAYTQSVNVNGGKGAVSGAEEVSVNFNVEEPGRYGVHFKGTGEWMIANIVIEYVPNIAGIDSKTKLYKSYMAALTMYEDNCDTERYNEKDMETLYQLVTKYEDFSKWSTDLGLTAPSQYEEAAKELDKAVESLKEFITLIDQYDALRVEDGKIAEVLANTAEEKVAKLECWSILKDSYEKYKDQTLTDKDQLREAVSLLSTNLIEVRRWNGEAVKTDGNVDDPWGHAGEIGLKALTRRIDIGVSTLKAMDPSQAESELVAKASAAITDDDAIANELKKAATNTYYKAMTSENADSFFKEQGYENEDGDYIQTSDGVYDFTFFLKNPFLYIITNNDGANPGNTLNAITVGTEEEPATIYQGDAFPGWTVSEGTGDWSTGWTNFKSINMPVDAMASNWGGSFTVSQSIEDLPAGLYILKGGINERDAYAEDSYFFWQTGADEDIVTMPVPSTGQNWNTGNISSARVNAIFVDGNEEVETDEDGNPTEEPVDDELLEILDGKLTIGAHAGANSHIFINNFQIFLVGKSANYDYAKGYADGINTVSKNTLKSVAVYDMNGRQMVRATKGVNLVKRTYSDGTVKVDKYIVK